MTENIFLSKKKNGRDCSRCKVNRSVTPGWMAGWMDIQYTDSFLFPIFFSLFISDSS